LEPSNVCKLNEDYNPITGTCTKKAPKFEKIEVKKEEDNVDSIDEQLKIPQMKYFITLFIQAVFIIIVGYIIYLFYNIFGETFFASLNWLTETAYNINDTRKINSLYNHIDASPDEEYTTLRKINKIKEDKLQRHIEHLKQKINELTYYEGEEKITKKQKKETEENDD
jgi:hypothetical protein